MGVQRKSIILSLSQVPGRSHLNSLKRNNLQLQSCFSFLNPDIILSKFVRDEKDVLDKDVREIVSDSFKFAKALLSLEKNSLLN